MTAAHTLHSSPENGFGLTYTGHSCQETVAEVHFGPTGGRGALGCDRTDRAVEHQLSTRPKSSAEKGSIFSLGTPIAKTTQRMPRQIPRLLVTVLDLDQLIYPSSDVLNTTKDRTDALELDRSWRGEVVVPRWTLPRTYRSNPLLFTGLCVLNSQPKPWSPFIYV